MIPQKDKMIYDTTNLIEPFPYLIYLVTNFPFPLTFAYKQLLWLKKKYWLSAQAGK